MKKKYAQKKTSPIFTHLKSLTVNKDEFDPEDDTQAKSYSPFMINRWLSMVNIFLFWVNEINMYQVDKATHYNYFKYSLPKKQVWFKYIKGAKEYDKEEKDALCKYFECGVKEAEGHIRVMKEEEIQEIIDLYSINN